MVPRSDDTRDGAGSAPLIQGRYRVLDAIYGSPESDVVAVTDVLRPEVALVMKTCRGRSSERPRAARLESEYRLLAGVRHPGLPIPYDFGFDVVGGKTFLVMRRGPGVTLDLLAPLETELLIPLLVDVVRVLSALHARGVMHLDIKPRNILHDPMTGQTTVLDLDLATDPEAAAGRGTAPYASPEVMGSGPATDFRGDLYSLGVTAYEVLTGETVSADRALVALRLPKSFPEWLIDLVSELTAPDPADRPRTARAVLARLRGSGMTFPEESVATRQALLSHPPFLGRPRELDALLQAIPTSSRRELRRPVVVVRGVPGVGKSRLVEEAAVEWRAAGLRVLVVRPQPGAARTLEPIRDVLDMLRAVSPTPDQVIEKEVGPRQGERLGIIDRLANELLGQARRRRTIIVLEDVDRFDRASSDFVVQFLRRHNHELWETGRPPLEIVLTARAGSRRESALMAFLDEEAQSGALLRLDVAPFDLGETAAFLRASVAPETVPPTLVAHLHDHAGGVPLFLSETILAHPLHPQGTGTLLGRLAVDAPGEDAVPRSVEAVVRSRFAACAAEDRPLLTVLAIFNRGSTAELLATITGEDPICVAERLFALTEMGMLISQGGRFHFPSGISRRVTLSSLDSAARRALHDRAAIELERTGAPPFDVIQHRLRGSEPRAALRPALDLVPALLNRREEEEAVQVLRLLASMDSISPFVAWWAVLTLVDTHLEQGQVDRAEQLMKELRELTPTSPAVIRREARVLQRRGGLMEALLRLEQVLKHPATLSRFDQLDLMLDQGEMLLLSGRHGDTRAVLDKCFPLVETYLPATAFAETQVPLEQIPAPRLIWPGEAAPLVSRFLALKADLARLEGDATGALRCQLAVMKLRSRLGDLVGLGRALHGIGTIFMSRGSMELAERYYQRALGLRAEVGDLAGQADTANNMGVLLRKTGRSAQAIEHFRTSLRIRRQIGYAAGEAFSYINIANVYYERRELGAAVRYYDRALEVARRLNDVRSQAQVLNNLGAVAHLRDRYREAIDFYAEAERLDRRVGNLNGALLKRLNLAAELIRVGMLDRATRLVATVDRITQRHGNRELRSQIFLLQGRLARGRGHLRIARDLLERALGEAEGRDDPEQEAEIGVELAEVGLRTGPPESALALLPADPGRLSQEARARLWVVRAQTLAMADPRDIAAVEPGVAEGERLARRAEMPGLEFLCARTRGALRFFSGDRTRALVAYESALAALECVLRSLGEGPYLESFLRRREIRSFAEEVERFSASLLPAGEGVLPGPAGDLVRRIRDALFDAGRRVGEPHGPSRRNEEALRRVLEISRTLRSTAPADELFREVVDGAIEFSGAERALLITVDDRGRIRIPVARTRGRESLPFPDQHISRRIVNEVLEKGRSIRITDAGGAYASAESVVNLDLRSVVCAPLLRGERVVGMLYLDNRSRVGQFTAADQELLDIFAAQAAIALENARLVREFARDEKIRVMGNLAGGVAHDFNNLLAAILGRAQELRNLTRDPTLIKGIETIVKAAEDGSAVVSRLQEFTRTRRTGEFTSVDLKGMVDDVLEFTRSRWEGDVLRRGFQIEVVLRIAEGLHVMGNVSELREIFTNLVLNSVAAMPEGGTLTVEARAEGELVRILLEDTGQGMTEEVRESIFDPYFTTRGTEGSGLGMSIVYNIVLRHQGTIRVDSAPGAGTRIAIALPAAEPPEAPVPVQVRGEQLPEGGRRVLVVEDEESVRHLLEDVLSAAGFDVISVSGGPEALQHLQHGEIDVVMTDLGMVPMSGWDVAREVKRIDPNTPVILVTGWGGEIDEATARRNRVDLLLSKPFDIHHVVECVKEALRIRDRAVSGATG